MVDVDGFEKRLVFEVGETHAEVFGIIDDVAHSQEFRYVIAGFVRHTQVFVDRLQALGSGAVYSAADIAFAPVVGSQRQRPVAEQAVQVLEVVQRGIGGGINVVAAVIQRGLLQAVVAAGGGHELPEAGCADVRFGFGNVRAFDEGQQGDFRRHVAFGHFVADVVHVGAAAFDGALEIGRRGNKLAFMAAYQLGIDFRHAEVAAQMRPNAVVTGFYFAVVEGDGVGAHHRHAYLIFGIGLPEGGSREER